MILSKSSAFTFKSILLVAFATYAESWSGGAMIEVSVDQFLYGLFILLILWFVLSGIILEGETNIFRCFLNRENPFKIPIYILPLCALTMFVFVAAFGGVEGKIFSKLQSYVSAGEGNSAKVSSQAKGYNLHYLDVVSTVREASEIPPDVVRNRILADAPSCSCPRCLPQDQKNNAWIIPSSLIGFFRIISFDAPILGALPDYTFSRHCLLLFQGSGWSSFYGPCGKCFINRIGISYHGINLGFDSNFFCKQKKIITSDA